MSRHDATDEGNQPSSETGGPADPKGSAVWGALEILAVALSAIGSIWIIALMVLIVLDVIGRNFLNQPIVGVAEIAGRSVISIVFLQLAAAVLQERLTRADLFLQVIGRYSRRLPRLLDAFFALAAILAFALILIAAWPAAVQTYAKNEFFGVQGVFTIPLWPFRFIMVGGIALAILSAIAVFLRQFQAARKV